MGGDKGMTVVTFCLCFQHPHDTGKGGADGGASRGQSLGGGAE